MPAKKTINWTPPWKTYKKLSILNAGRQFAAAACSRRMNAIHDLEEERFDQPPCDTCPHRRVLGVRGDSSTSARRNPTKSSGSGQTYRRLGKAAGGSEEPGGCCARPCTRTRSGRRGD